MPGPERFENPLSTTLPMDMHTVSGSGLTVVGVEGTSTQNNGVHGTSAAPGASGVYGDNTSGGYGIAGRSMDGIGVFGEGRLAGQFVGDVEVSGDIRLMNADCAEEYELGFAETSSPGTVMVLDDNGAVRPGDSAYDKRVAGVISGAGSYRPAIVLDRQETPGSRVPIAMLGKVYCLVDADYAPVEVGDLLTTSLTLGHAMKATDPQKGFGSVIGKALKPMSAGKGLIPILVALQ